MNTIGTRRWRLLIVIGGLLLVMAIALVACGGSSPSPAKTAASIPDATPGTGLAAGTIQAFSTVDIFESSFTGSDGQTYWVTVKLSKPDSPKPGESAIQVSSGNPQQAIDMTKLLVVGTGAGVAYMTPQGEAQATFPLTTPEGASVEVVFTAQSIDKVTLTGNGSPTELQRQQ